MATYDPSKTIFTFMGSIGTGIVSVSAEHNVDMWSQNVSTDGKVLDVKSLNETGIVTVVLQQSSPLNDIFSAAAALDRLTNAGKGVAGITDLNGTTLVMAFDARVRKVAAAEFGADGTDRTWVIQCQKLVNFVGGQL